MKEGVVNYYTDILERLLGHSFIVLIDRIKFTIANKYLDRDIIKSKSRKAKIPFYTFYSKKSKKMCEVYKYYHHGRDGKEYIYYITLMPFGLSLEFNDILQSRYDETTIKKLVIDALTNMSELNFFYNPKELTPEDLANYLWTARFQKNNIKREAISFSEIEIATDFAPGIGYLIYKDILTNQYENIEYENGTLYSKEKYDDNKSLFKIYCKSRQLREDRKNRFIDDEDIRYDDIFRQEFTFKRESIKSCFKITKRDFNLSTFDLFKRRIYGKKFYNSFKKFANLISAGTIQKIINIIWNKDYIFSEKYTPQGNIVKEFYFCLYANPFTFDNHQFAARFGSPVVTGKTFNRLDSPYGKRQELNKTLRRKSRKLLNKRKAERLPSLF